jgi:uncharacterized protein YndB with AHSA1/START domain
MPPKRRIVIQTCPTDVIAAPVERVWDLLTQPERLARWSGTTLQGGPHRALATGDRLTLTRFGLRVRFEVGAIEPRRILSVDVRLPFGVVNHETIRIAPLEGGQCRVSFG